MNDFQYFGQNSSTFYMLQPLEVNRYETCKVNPDNITLKTLTKYESISIDENLEIIKTIFGCIILFPVCILGIIGNILCLVILYHQCVKNASTYCLMALAISDLILLCNGLLFSLMLIYVKISPINGHNFRGYLFPYLGMYTSIVSARITSLITTLISMERFVAVRFPMKAKTVCSKKATIISIVFIYIITIIVFIPYPFKYSVVHTLKDNNSYTIIARNENLSERFCKCYWIAMNALFRFIPIALVLILNISIFSAVKSTSKIRRSLRLQKMSKNHAAEERKCTVMLFVVSLTFLICILPGAINALLQLTWKEYSRFGRSYNLQICISYVTFFLEVTNSSVNFIIYMALSSRFKIIFKQMFHTIHKCCRRVVLREKDMNSSTTQKSFSLSRKSSFSISDEDEIENATKPIIENVKQDKSVL